MQETRIDRIALRKQEQIQNVVVDIHIVWQTLATFLIKLSKRENEKHESFLDFAEKAALRR